MVCSLKMQAQDKQSINGYLVPMCIYNGDTIPCVQLRTVYIFRPLKFKNEKERLEYYRLVRNVKKVYPISKEINQAIIETYEYLQTLPNEKARQKTSQTGGKRTEGTIYRTDEETLFYTRQTLD